MSKYSREDVVIGVLFVAFFAGLIFHEAILDQFRLDGSDTLYDYHTSSFDERVDFAMRMCNDGECLDIVDWRCGMDLTVDIEQEDRISDCFHEIARKAKSWTTLDEVRKYCGKRHAIFTGDYGDKDSCRELKGDWGKAKKPRRIRY